MGSSVSRVLGIFEVKFPQIVKAEFCLMYVLGEVAHVECTRPRGEGTPKHVVSFGSSLSLLPFSISGVDGAAAAFARTQLRVKHRGDEDVTMRIRAINVVPT